MRFFCLLCVTIMMAACANDSKMPKDVIPQQKMKEVLFDVLRAQEYASTKYGFDTLAVNKNMAVMLQQVFEIHKISKENFYDSFQYYEAHPDKNKELFDSLTAYTAQKRQDIYSHLR